MKTTSKMTYSSPEAEAVSIQTEQCIATSPNNTLEDMDVNDVYDEDF